MLTLERVPGQRPLEDIAAVPEPSQLDDWQLFEKYEGEMIRQRRGDQGYLAWKTTKAEERINLEQWRRTLELRAELRGGMSWSRSGASLLSQTEVRDGDAEPGK